MGGAPDKMDLYLLEEFFAGVIAREASATPAEPSAVIGENIPGKGVYIGTWQLPSARYALVRTFNVYAAPVDLSNKNDTRICRSFYDAVKEISKLRDWHGHDGGNYKSVDELNRALDEGEYKGTWIIPPIEILTGRNKDNELVQKDSLYAHRNKGVLAGSFATGGGGYGWYGPSGTSYPTSYWSCTASKNGDWSVLSSEFTGNNSKPGRSNYKSGGPAYSCRPIRLELCRGPKNPGVL